MEGKAHFMYQVSHKNIKPSKHDNVHQNKRGDFDFRRIPLSMHGADNYKFTSRAQ